MKNKDNVVRQIYLSIFRDKKKVSEIINYKDVNEDQSDFFKIIKKSSYNSLNGAGKSNLQFGGMSGSFPMLKNKIGPPTPIIFPITSITHPVDIQRVRMFMFKYYIGKVEWNKVFFGE
jgi:hypothetical protein